MDADSWTERRESRRMRSLLEEAAPEVDLDAEWEDLEPRLDPGVGLGPSAGRRGPGRATWIAAAAAAVVVVGVGAVTLRSPGSAPQELDVQAPAAASQAPTTDAPAPVSDVLELTCSGSQGSVATPVVATRPDGVAVQASGDGFVLFRPAGGGAVAGAIESALTGTFDGLAPGSYDVRCGDRPDAEGTPIGTVEVVDPAGNHVADTSGLSPGQPAPCTDFTMESYVRGATSADDAVAWRFGPQPVTFFGYVQATVRSFVVEGPAGLVASGSVAAGPDGGWLTVRACPGAKPLPAGDGLRPASPLRTEAQALAWLDSSLSGGTMPGMGVPEGATIVRREAKLIRLDETTPIGPHTKAMVPGHSGWVVAVSYLDAGGQPGAATYTFSPESLPSTLTKDGVPGVPEGWPAWFDALPDHAS